MRVTGICYLCGINKAETWDHVPPQGLFPQNGVEHRSFVLGRKTTSKGYKLPACAQCNNILRLEEEYIRDRFSIVGQNSTAREIFKTKTEPSYLREYEKTKKVGKLDLIRRDMILVSLKDSTGKVLKTIDGIKIDSERVNKVATKIVKGLHYHHFGEKIPESHVFKIYWDPPDWLPGLLEKKSSLIGRFY